MDVTSFMDQEILKNITKCLPIVVDRVLEFVLGINKLIPSPRPENEIVKDVYDKLKHYLTTPKNLVDITMILLIGQHPSKQMMIRKDNRKEEIYAIDLIGNWIMEDHIVEHICFFIKEEGCFSLYNNSSDQKRELNWFPLVRNFSSPDFINNKTGQQVEFKTNLRPSQDKISIKKNGVPRAFLCEWEYGKTILEKNKCPVLICAFFDGCGCSFDYFQDGEIMTIEKRRNLIYEANNGYPRIRFYNIPWEIIIYDIDGNKRDTKVRWGKKIFEIKLNEIEHYVTYDEILNLREIHQIIDKNNFINNENIVDVVYYFISSIPSVKERLKMMIANYRQYFKYDVDDILRCL